RITHTRIPVPAMSLASPQPEALETGRAKSSGSKVVISLSRITHTRSPAPGTSQPSPQTAHTSLHEPDISRAPPEPQALVTVRAELLGSTAKRSSSRSTQTRLPELAISRASPQRGSLDIGCDT